MTDPVFERIERLLKEKGKTMTEFNSTLGVNRNTYYNWKHQKSKSYLKHIDEIARFFDVSPQYISRGVDGEPEELKSAAEDELLRAFRQLSEARQECVINIVKMFLVD